MRWAEMRWQELRWDEMKCGAVEREVHGPRWRRAHASLEMKQVSAARSYSISLRQLLPSLARVLISCLLPRLPYSHNGFQRKMWLEGTSHAHLKARPHELTTCPLDVRYCCYLLCMRGWYCKFEECCTWDLQIPRSKSLGLLFATS